MKKNDIVFDKNGHYYRVNKFVGKSEVLVTRLVCFDDYNYGEIEVELEESYQLFNKKDLYKNMTFKYDKELAKQLKQVEDNARAVRQKFDAEFNIDKGKKETELKDLENEITELKKERDILVTRKTNGFKQALYDAGYKNGYEYFELALQNKLNYIVDRDDCRISSISYRDEISFSKDGKVKISNNEGWTWYDYTEEKFALFETEEEAIAYLRGVLETLSIQDIEKLPRWRLEDTFNKCGLDLPYFMVEEKKAKKEQEIKQLKDRLKQLEG